MKPIWQNLGLCLALILALNGVDYAQLINAFDDGKTRYLLLSLVPISFIFVTKRLGWAPALVSALALFSWVVHDYKPSHDTVLPIISIFACLGLASAVVYLGERLFGNILIASGLVQGVIALLQWARAIGVLPFGFPHHELPDGLIGNSTLLAPFLVICLAPAIWRGIWWAVIPIAAAVLACHSVGGLVCLTALLLLRFGIFIPFAAAMLYPLGLYFGVCHLYGRSLIDSDGRYFMWSFGWRAIREHFWFGSGIGAWENIYLPRFQNELLESFHYHLPRALHNDYIDFAIEYGCAPLCALFVGLIAWLRKFRPTWPHAVCATTMVDACFSFPAPQIYMAVPFLVCWKFSEDAA